MIYKFDILSLETKLKSIQQFVNATGLWNKNLQILACISKSGLDKSALAKSTLFEP